MNNFKTIEWIRNVRDNNYQETKNLKPKDLIKKYKNKSKKISIIAANH